MLRSGYSIPFVSPPPLSRVPVPFDSYSPSSTKGVALQGKISALIKKGAVELITPSLGFYSCVFVVMKALGSWRPIINLSILNKFTRQSRFKMEANQSVLNAIQGDNWMFSIDLKNTCLQVPFHPGSRKCLHLVAFSKVFQFKVLCLGLFTAPQVFTRVMDPVSTILHHLGVQILRYLDDWLFLASSRVGSITGEGLSINSLSQSRHSNQFQEVSSFSFSDVLLFRHDSREPDFEDFPDAGTSVETSIADRRISVLQAAKRRLVEEPAGTAFHSLPAFSRGSAPYEVPPVAVSMGFPGQISFGHLDILEHTRSVLVVGCLDLLAGAYLEPRLLDLLFWSDASNLGLGTNLVDQFVSRVWSPEEYKTSINWRELRTIHVDCFIFASPFGQVGVSVLRQHHGPHLPEEAGRHVITAFEFQGSTPRMDKVHGDQSLAPVRHGVKNVVVDSLSCRHQVLGSE